MGPGYRAFRISLVYFLAGALWIALSDRLLPLWAPGGAISSLQTYKGWFFVLVTAVLLYHLVLRALESVQASERRFRDVVMQAPYPVMLHGDAGNVILLNRTWTELTGYSGEEVPTIDAWAESALGSADRAGEWLRCASQPGGCEFVVNTREGKQRVWKCSAARLAEVAGEAVVITVAVDITDQKSLEAQLAHSQKMEAVGRLAGSVAHDFNNLLTIMAGHTFVLRDELAAGHPLSDNIREIDAAVERGAELTRQLLTFSKRQPLRPTVVDMNAVVREARAMLTRIIGESVTLTVAFSPEPCRVKADAGQLVQVLLNLAVNARDAMPDGGNLVIAISRANMPEHGGPAVRLLVQDSGHGMEPEVIDRIYEPFFTTKQSGTGLGLATVYGIVKQSGGHITVESAPGAGAAFTILLPESLEPVEAKPANKPSHSALRGTEVILLAEDDDSVRAMISTALAGNGYRVLVARSGEAALRLAAEHYGRVDLLITDIVMPGVNGRQLADKLRASRPGLRVLYISGYSDHALLEGEAEPALLRKPFTPDVLAQRVRAVLESR